MKQLELPLNIPRKTSKRRTCPPTLKDGVRALEIEVQLIRIQMEKYDGKI